MEQHFSIYQLDISKTDDSTSCNQSSDCGDDRENSSVLVQQMWATVTIASSTTVLTTRGTFQFLLSVSMKFLICAKWLIELKFTY